MNIEEKAKAYFPYHRWKGRFDLDLYQFNFYEMEGFIQSLLEERERDLKAWKHLAESRQRIMNNWIEKYDLPIHEATLDLNQKEF